MSDGVLTAVPPTPANAGDVCRRRQLKADGFERPSLSVYPTVVTARTLLRARGWIVAGMHATSPDGKRYWHLDEALHVALEAEAELLERE